jgi:hypothetical protein
VEQIRLRDNISIVAAEGELVVRINRGMMAATPPCFFLGATRPHESEESSEDSPRHKNFRGESCGERIELGFRVVATLSSCLGHCLILVDLH